MAFAPCVRITAFGCWSVASVLVTFGRYQTVDGLQPQLGTDFAGVVTAVGPDVTDLVFRGNIEAVATHNKQLTNVG